MVWLTLTLSAPWHAGHTVAALALPASMSAADAMEMPAATASNPIGIRIEGSRFGIEN
jgi:hypothetical protein